MLIYCVDDDTGIRELVTYTLNNTGFVARGFYSGEELFVELHKELPDMFILDIMLPQEDGNSILKKLRGNAKTHDIPVIMLTAKANEYDKIMGLDNGADDYITKPFSVMELVSRVKAVERRYHKEENSYSYKGVTLNVRSHTVTVNGVEIVVTLKEYELLLMFLKNIGKVLTRDMLLESIWGYDFDGETRTVDVHVRILRAKLPEDYIETVRGVGYKIG